MALLVFALFAVCVLLVLLTGARIYRNLVDRGRESYEARTAAQYITTRVRQAESVTVENFEGCEALVLSQQIDGETYLTRVYCLDGTLWELFCAEDMALSPEDGESLLPVNGLSASVEDGLLTVRIDSRELTLWLGGKEAAP